MKRSIALLALLMLVAACGTTRASAPGASATPVASGRLVIEGGERTLVLDPQTGAVKATLPGGTLSPAGDLIVRTAPAGDKTRVVAYDLSGAQQKEWMLAGDFKLPAAYGPSASGFSPNGRWLVLVARTATASSFAILDVANGTSATPVELGARFSFDAIHDSGSALYLIEHPVAGSTAYNVRLYDVQAKRMQAEPIFDKAQLVAYDPAAGLMDGAFHVSVAPAGGDWSYGLYVKRDGRPFVHALNVAQRYATCIVDLPGTRTADSALSLALGPNARALYVVDTGTGSISEIDALTQKVKRSASFPAHAGGGVRSSAVVSPDGGRLYATGATGIAAIVTHDLSFRVWAAPDVAARSLAIAADGTRVYALADDGVHVLEGSSGRELARYDIPVGGKALRVLAP
ncbi:MAG: hypothetical protein HY071_03855 [Chloroflexi bacterium]|nr:hypothetical protein [Chloroflexota bacterium]